MSNNPIWDLMYKGESGARGYDAFNRGTYTGADGKQHIRPGTPPIDFSQLTLGQVQDLQHLPRRDPDRVFALGKYQIVPDTMDAAVARLGLDRNERFTPALQDRIFSEYLMRDKQPTVRDYVMGRSDDLRAAQRGLAMEWASFPDPDRGGRSYHGGANQAHVSLAESEAALRQLRQQYQEARQQGLSENDAWRQATRIEPGEARTTPDPARQRQQPAADPLADGVLSAGERGAAVQQLQRSLNTLGVHDDRGQALEARSGIYGDRTAEAVRRFQSANGIEPTGNADQRTREAIEGQVRQRAESPQPAERQDPQSRGTGTWPAPGNYSLNQADKPGEGRGEWNTRRSGHRDGDGHDGVDIQGQVGDPIVAFRGGTARAFSHPAAGNYIVVDHGDGTSSRYLHLDTMRARPGETFQVREGEQIGTMGRTGNTPRQGDTHLHFEYKVNGRDVDPMPHLNRAAREGAVREGAQPPARESTPQPAASRAMADGVLKPGERGPEVIALQERLNALGYRGRDGQPLETRSGIYGPETEHAVRDFQTRHGLGVDGKAGQRETLPAVERAGRQPLVSEATHPNNGMFTEVSRRLAEQTGQPVRPEVAANVTQQMLQNGFRSAEDIRGIAVRGTDIHVQGPVAGSRVSVDLNAPTADMQTMSDYMSRQTQEQSQQQERQRQQATPGVMMA